MAKILITDPRHPMAEELAVLLRRDGHEVDLAPGNASSPEEVREVLKRTGTPDLLILSEYSDLRAGLACGDADAIAHEVEDKLTSAFLYAKHFGAKMAEGGSGGILILGSLAADKPTGAVPAYAMTDPKILILDEAFSGLDPLTESAVFDGLKRMMHGRTVIIVSHERTLGENADQVVRMDSGTVVP